MKKAVIKGDQLVGLSGNIFEDGLYVENGRNKYFAAVVMCGHVGRGFYVPILFPIAAKDAESAKKIVKNFPRVKNNIPNFILSMKEISFLEAEYIRLINHFDSYLTYSAKKPSVEHRRIVLPKYAEKVVDKSKGKKLSPADMRLIEISKIDSPDEIKLAKDYSEYLILQRYFAPSLIGNNIVYPKRVDMDLLLRDYFTNKAEYLGITKGKPALLVGYYKIFGADNPMGIDVDEENVYFTDIDGEKRSFPLDSYSHSLLEIEDSTRLADAIKAKTKQNQQTHETACGKAKSGLERFNERMQKTLQMKGKDKEKN